MGASFGRYVTINATSNNTVRLELQKVPVARAMACLPRSNAVCKRSPTA